jgi:SAM-dependent methyltransferase
MMENLSYKIKLFLPSSFKKRAGKLKRKIYAFFLQGNKIECPICGNTYKKFLSAGVVKRKNAVCPGCDSFERHRLLWLYVSNKINSTRVIKLLHFAPEDSLKEKFSKLNNINYITTDLYESGVSLNSDIQCLPFKDNIFDVIICSHVLEHIPDDKKGMKEILRVLKKDGWGILQVPINEKFEKTYEDPSITSSLERLKHFGQEDHVRVYGRDYYQKLEQAGFIVKKDNFAQNIPEDKIKRYSLKQDEIICFVTRQNKYSE